LEFFIQNAENWVFWPSKKLHQGGNEEVYLPSTPFVLENKETAHNSKKGSEERGVWNLGFFLKTTPEGAKAGEENARRNDQKREWRGSISLVWSFPR